MKSNMLRGANETFDKNKYYHYKKILIDYHKIYLSIDHVIRNRRDISDGSINARVFINKGTRDDFGMMVSANPPQQHEELDAWLERITKAKSYCAVLNGISGWSDYIANRVKRDFINEWIDTLGIPSGGVDVYCFMGKYGITPFGIHKDQENTFLFHLGPNMKKAWIWDPSVKDIAPIIKSDSFKLTETLSYAHYVELEPGDSLFIPENWFHVLENPDFSATLGVAPYEKKNTELFSTCLKDLLAENLVVADYKRFPLVTDNGDLYDFNFILPNHIWNLSLREIFSDGISLINDALRSNDYFKYSSPLRKIQKKEYRYYGGFYIGYDNGQVLRLHCRGKILLIKNQYREKFLEIQHIISSPDFVYDRGKYQPRNFVNDFFDKLISVGVLI